MSDTKGLDLLPLDEKMRLVRSERYELQSVARTALPNESVVTCLRIPVQSHVEVRKHRETSKAFYCGLAVCGRGWICPVCAGKISERRRQELQSAYNQHLASGGHVALMTLTFSHKKGDRLKETLARFSKASSAFRSGEWFQNIRDQLGLIGSIRAFEITYGSNGWHPHTHIAMFYTNQVDLQLIEYFMKKRWKEICIKNGLNAKEKYGLTLEDGEKADEYMAKHGTWGLDRELTKAHIKKGRKESITPFDLLRLVLETGEKKYISLFVEYAEALKGKTQLYWSQGLKKRFLLKEMSDEELAKESREKADVLALIDHDTWRLIRKREKRAYVLDLAEKEKDGQAFLEKIKKEFSPATNK